MEGCGSLGVDDVCINMCTQQYLIGINFADNNDYVSTTSFCTLIPTAEPRIVAMWNNVLPFIHLKLIIISRNVYQLQHNYINLLLRLAMFCLRV